MKIKSQPLPKEIFCVDPGSTESAYVVLGIAKNDIREFGKCANLNLRLRLIAANAKPEVVVCEEICSYGMAVGATTFDTVRFTGRIEQICADRAIPFVLIPRTKVKSALKPLPRKNDRDVRASLMKLYGDPGKKSAPGPTYGITKDVWAALGVAHAYRKRLIK